jgi:hypothetical protein
MPGRRGTAAALASAVALTGALGVATVPTPAGSSADVNTDPRGAHVVLGRHGEYLEIGHPGGSGSSGGSGGGCRRQWVAAPAPVYLRPQPHGIPGGEFLPPPPSVDARPYHVFCDGAYVTTVWLLPTQFTTSPAGPTVHDLAEQLVRDLPYPAAAVGVSPDRRGLTGLESWYWVEGYDGAPLTDSVSGFGIRVDVEARPAAVRWDFGDGTEPADAGLGLPPPQRSTVTHVYERRSPEPGYAVRVDFELATRYRVDGGDWIDLPPVIRSGQRAYTVVESRAQLVPVPGDQ